MARKNHHAEHRFWWHRDRHQRGERTRDGADDDAVREADEGLLADDRVNCALGRKAERKAADR